MGGLPAGLVCIGDHEQGRDGYATNTGNGFTGRYQYTHKTWNNYKGYAEAYLAPPNIQDERALSDYNLGPAHRHQEWPRSSRTCGV